MSRALVIGYGSIGARHARLLREDSHDVAVVSRREVDFPTVFPSIAAAMREPWHYAVVASQTGEHAGDARTLAECGFRGDALIEKPLARDEAEWPRDLPFGSLFVAYNLRFHPLIQRLRDELRGETVLAAHIYAGQYLPDWRPDTDYRASYSASRERGGGALRDLSHELDLVLWLLGPATRVMGMGGHLSPLDISSDDHFSLLLQTRDCPHINMALSYLDRVPRREFIVHTASHTLRADLLSATLHIDARSESCPGERDDTHRALHRAVLTGEGRDDLCSEGAGLEVLRVIGRVEAVRG